MAITIKSNKIKNEVSANTPKQKKVWTKPEIIPINVNSGFTPGGLEGQRTRSFPIWGSFYSS